MNVLFVCPVFAKNEKDTSIGGMSYAVYKMAYGLLKIGHEAVILSLGTHNRSWHYHGIPIETIENINRKEGKGFLDTAQYIIRREKDIENRIIEIHNKKRIDIIQYGGWFGVGSLYTGKIPAVMRISTYTKAQLPDNFSLGKRLALSHFERVAAKKIGAVYSPSKLMADAMGKDIHQKITVLETPFLKEEIFEDNKLYLDKLAGKKYLLFFSRMSIDKGIYVVGDILYETLKTNDNIYFVFAGPSDIHNGVRAEDELLNKAREYRNRLVFLGYLGKEALYPVIRNAEAILMPSITDNLPNACSEAMSMGKIVIGTDGSSLEQFIDNRINGYLAKVGDSDSLRKCINEVLHLGKTPKTEMSKRAVEKIERFNILDFSYELEALLQDTINKKQRMKNNE